MRLELRYSQPIQEAAPNKGDVGLTGPIVTAIIIVTDISGIFEFVVKGAFETTSAKNSFSDALNNHGVIYHACCESDSCCGMVNCRDLKEKKSGEACKNSNCVKISNEKMVKAAKLKAAGK